MFYSTITALRLYDMVGEFSFICIFAVCFLIYMCVFRLEIKQIVCITKVAGSSIQNLGSINMKVVHQMFIESLNGCVLCYSL